MESSEKQSSKTTILIYYNTIECKIETYVVPDDWRGKVVEDYVKLITDFTALWEKGKGNEAAKKLLKQTWHRLRALKPSICALTGAILPEPVPMGERLDEIRNLLNI